MVCPKVGQGKPFTHQDKGKRIEMTWYSILNNHKQKKVAMSKTKYKDKVTEIQMILEDLVVEANDVCQFSQRNSPLDARRFVQLLVLGWLKQGDASLNALAEMGTGLGVRVTGSAIHERVGASAVDLLETVLMSAIEKSAQMRPEQVAVLSQFQAVYVTDSTQISLPKHLRGLFAGSNQDAKIKLQVVIDYQTNSWVKLEVEEGKATDRSSDLPVRQAVAKSLNIFDLGYHKQERLRDIDQQEAYFVTRYQSQTGLYDAQTKAGFDLIAYLKACPHHHIDIGLRLGSRVKHPIRLVARKVPEAIAAKRRRSAKKKAREQGYTCSSNYLYLLSWDMLITNLSDADFTLAQVFALYPIRMQIEWVFRIWKSQLQLDHFGNWRLHRVLAQLYAHLIGILLCHRLTTGWLWRHDTEHSFAKCVQIIQHKLDPLMAILKRHWYGFQAWIQRLDASFSRFGRKSKRKTEPSTLQTLINLGLT